MRRQINTDLEYIVDYYNINKNLVRYELDRAIDSFPGGIYLNRFKEYEDITILEYMEYFLEGNYD